MTVTAQCASVCHGTGERMCICTFVLVLGDVDWGLFAKWSGNCSKQNATHSCMLPFYFLVLFYALTNTIPLTQHKKGQFNPFCFPIIQLSGYENKHVHTPTDIRTCAKIRTEPQQIEQTISYHHCTGFCDCMWHDCLLWMGMTDVYCCYCAWALRECCRECVCMCVCICV